MKVIKSLNMGNFYWGSSPLPHGMVMVGALDTGDRKGALLRTQNGLYILGNDRTLSSLNQHDIEMIMSRMRQPRYDYDTDARGRCFSDADCGL